MSTNIYQSFRVPVSVSNEETGMTLDKVSIWVKKAPAGAFLNVEVHQLDLEYSGADISEDRTVLARSSATISAAVDLTAPASATVVDFSLLGIILKQGARYAINISSTSNIQLFAARVGEESLVNPGRLIQSNVLADGSTFTINNLAIVREYGEDLMFSISARRFAGSGSKSFRLRRLNTYKIIRFTTRSIFDISRIKNGLGITNDSNPLTSTETMPTIVSLAFSGGNLKNEFKAIVFDPSNKLTGVGSPSYGIKIHAEQNRQVAAVLEEFLPSVDYDSLQLTGLVRTFDSSDVEVKFRPFGASTDPVASAVSESVELDKLEIFEGFEINGSPALAKYRPNVDEDERFDITLKSRNQFVSPLLYPLELKARLGTKLIPVASSIDQRAEIVGDNAASARYVSRPIQLAVGQEAEDLVVLATAEVPRGTRLMAYARFVSPEDSGTSIETRPWSPLTLQQWPAQPFDGTRKEYRWNLPSCLIETGPVVVEDYPFVYETPVTTTSGQTLISFASQSDYFRAFVNGWGVGDTIVSSAFPADTVIIAKDDVNYRVTVNNAATASGTQTIRIFATPNGHSYGFINKGDDDASAEVDFSGVARYAYNFAKTGEQVFYGIRTFQFKIIMITDLPNQHKYPKLYDVRAIALQA